MVEPDPEAANALAAPTASFNPLAFFAAVPNPPPTCPTALAPAAAVVAIVAMIEPRVMLTDPVKTEEASCGTW
jgi:hypothetical protein